MPIQMDISKLSDIELLTQYADITGNTRQWVPTELMPEVAYYAGKLGGEASEFFMVVEAEFTGSTDIRTSKVPDKQKCLRELCDVLWYFARIVEAPEVGLRASPFLARAPQFSAPAVEKMGHPVALMFVCGSLQEYVFKNYRNIKKPVANINDFGFYLHFVATCLHRSAFRLGASLADVARIGIEKQAKRISEGTVAGVGSDR